MKLDWKVKLIAMVVQFLCWALRTGVIPIELKVVPKSSPPPAPPTIRRVVADLRNN